MTTRTAAPRHTFPPDTDTLTGTLTRYVRGRGRHSPVPEVILDVRGAVKLNPAAAEHLGQPGTLHISLHPDATGFGTTGPHLRLSRTPPDPADPAMPDPLCSVHATGWSSPPGTAFSAREPLRHPSLIPLNDLSMRRYRPHVTPDALHVALAGPWASSVLHHGAFEAPTPLPALMTVPADLDLEDEAVISVLRRNQLGVRLQALERLGDPRAVVMYTDLDRQLLALEACSPDDPDAFALHDTQHRNRQLSCSEVLRLLRAQPAPVRHYVARPLPLPNGPGLLIDLAGPAYGRLRVRKIRPPRRPGT